MHSRWLAADYLRLIGLLRFATWVVWAIVAVPCSADDESADSSTEPPAATQPTVEAGATEALSRAKPTEQECQTFVTSLKEAVASKEAKSINALFDWDLVLARGTAGLDPQQVDGPDLLAKFRGIEDIVDGDVNPVIGTLTLGTSYRPLRVRYNAGRPEVVCRLLLSENRGVTYQVLPLERRSDGAVLASDLYQFSAGESISDTFRRFVLSSLARSNPQALTKTSAREREFLRHVATCERMINSINQGDYDETLAAFALLPTALQREKPILLMRLRAAPKLGLHGWQQVLNEVRQLFPNDPVFDLQLMGDYNQLGKRDEALAAIDRLEKSIGGDPYLLLLRGNVYLQARNLRLAKRWVDNAIAGEPELVLARISRINCALYENDFAEVVQQLEELERLGERLADLTQVPGYKRFVASPEYRNWMNSRRKISPTKAK